jgi:hypothetical protein
MYWSSPTEKQRERERERLTNLYLDFNELSDVSAEAIFRCIVSNN